MELKNNITLTFLVLIIIFLIATHDVRGQLHSENFDGFYIGLTSGIQNIFAGSLIQGEDILAQDSRFVLEIPIGFRKQIVNDRLLIGGEVHYGFADGNLKHIDMERELVIDYNFKSQYGFGITLGYVIGNKKNYLLYVYGNETKRKFDNSILSSNVSFSQKDKQGMLRYGLGFEWAFFKKLHARLSAGKLRVDFGDIQTNIDVEDQLDYNIGLLYQF
ncbi:hypothetical protein GTQ34_15880 [Muricauda sp. JGD-17]|uniref:Outer membrane protein beta-barrel domain-containing protein n=1 Tax=Flagellimonas ochracea TaxID=2696472 RepID=A0A964TEC5_9FLAO|nr:outer membrane beta-barrel protein [Allomuricauda ochracea]NAY93390.1 hypothetical protein [Allomuricauda ochracea]